MAKLAHLNVQISCCSKMLSNIAKQIQFFANSFRTMKNWIFDMILIWVYYIRPRHGHVWLFFKEAILEAIIIWRTKDLNGLVSLLKTFFISWQHWIWGCTPWNYLSAFSYSTIYYDNNISSWWNIDRIYFWITFQESLRK